MLAVLKKALDGSATATETRFGFDCWDTGGEGCFDGLNDAGLSCDTYLNPGFLLLVGRVILGLARAVDGLTFSWRREIIDRAGGRSLPVLHLDEGGRTRQRG